MKKYRVKDTKSINFFNRFLKRNPDYQIRKGYNEYLDLIKNQILRKKNSERKRKQISEKLEILFNNTQVGIMVLKKGRKIKEVNKRMADILGYDSLDELAGADITEVHLSEKNYNEFGHKYYNALTNGTQLQIEYQLKRRDGSAVWCTLSGKAVDSLSPPDLNKGVIWMIDDITDRKIHEEKLKEYATKDSLTGLFNRRHFFETGDSELKRHTRHKRPVSVIIADADYFKKVNDTCGHQAGDEVLKAISSIIMNSIRSEDTAARIGGEEFAVLLPETSIEKALVIAERIREKISMAETETHSGPVSITLSLGVAEYNYAEDDIFTLINCADKALYTAKRNGRNRVEKYRKNPG